MRSATLRLFAMAVFAGASFMMGSVARAGVTPKPDHLKCYQVVNDTNSRDKEIVDLFNQQFGPELGCTLVTQAPLFCAPTEKRSGPAEGDDPRGPALQTDFLCYKVKCPKRDKQDILVNDQFGQRVLTIKDAQLLCTPTVKASPPPFCGQEAGSPQCSGSCPVVAGFTQQCVQSAAGDCVCQFP